MDLSIVILNYRSKGLVKQCLKTLALYGIKGQHEIIVVDNDSRDGVGAMVKERFPEARFIQTGRNAGFAAGNNVGVNAATGRYVMIMNPDITVRPGSVDALVEFMDRHPDVGIAGPRLVRPDGSVDESCCRFPNYLIPVYRRTPLGRTASGRRALDQYLMADYDRRDTRHVDWLLGAVLIVRRSALEEVGVFDERYFMYFEDTDWCRRFWAAGWQVVYYPGSEMVHLHERLSAQAKWYAGAFNKATRIHLASCVKYFMKWRHTAHPVSDHVS